MMGPFRFKDSFFLDEAHGVRAKEKHCAQVGPL